MLRKVKNGIEPFSMILQIITLPNMLFDLLDFFSYLKLIFFKTTKE